MRGLSLFALFALASAATAQLRQVVAGDFNTGSARAVVVRGSSLAHTSQMLPLDRRGKITGSSAEDQAHRVLDSLELALGEARSTLTLAARINWCVTDPGHVTGVMNAMAARFDDNRGPAVSFVVTPLPHKDAFVAADAVAVCREPSKAVARFECARLRGQPGESHVAVLPDGARVYISGQAEKGDLKAATRKTLESLRDTLTFLRLKDEHVVQIKAFVTPMTAAADVVAETEKFFGKGKMPPLVLVEWKSSLPIEIELIAAAGPARESSPDVVEYLAPPALKHSPIFSRIVKVNFGPTIYLSSQYGKSAPDANAEITELFKSLEGVLKESGSDFKHLVKATYYVATEPASQALNELRPRYYNAKRPPAASKAMVAGVGRAGHGITLDMIAVPTLQDTKGPAEHGHGLTAKGALEGWISLYDGKTSYGWTGAKVEGGSLIGGKSTTEFGLCSIRAFFTRGGTLTVGGREHEVEEGTFSLDEVDGGRIELGKGAAVRALVLCPLKLKALFNGTNMDGWKRIDHPRIAEDKQPKWKVEDAKIIAVGGPGAIEYTEKYGNLVLQVEARTRARHVNGGVFFRCIPRDFMNGYEMQIYNRCKDGDPAQPAQWATGGIDDRLNARRLISRDLEPFKLTVIARGPHIATWVNGHQVTDWTDDRAPDVNPRKGRRVEPGTIQLQAHDTETDLEFRDVRAAGLK